MIELREEELFRPGRSSSKGNQLKAKRGDIWYKADYCGYEGLAEYVVSHLLKYSNLAPDEYLMYQTEELHYRQTYRGCSSHDFIRGLGTEKSLERLYKEQFGESLHSNIYKISGIEDRILFLVSQVERMTGIKDYGKYLCKAMEIDAFFLNEDRHMHNLAVIQKKSGEYVPAPLYDHGGSLLADTTVDYPIGADLYEMIDRVKSKTVSDDFDEQTDSAEKLYGKQLTLHFGKKDVETILNNEPYYPDNIKNRVRDILFERMRKYSYFF